MSPIGGWRRKRVLAVSHTALRRESVEDTVSTLRSKTKTPPRRCAGATFRAQPESAFLEQLAPRQPAAHTTIRTDPRNTGPGTHLVSFQSTVVSKYPCCIRRQFSLLSTFPTRKATHACVCLRACVCMCTCARARTHTLQILGDKTCLRRQKACVECVLSLPPSLPSPLSTCLMGQKRVDRGEQVDQVLHLSHASFKKKSLLTFIHSTDTRCRAFGSNEILLDLPWVDNFIIAWGPCDNISGTCKGT